MTLPIRLAALLLALAATAPRLARADGDGPIEDNSFLIEEAYNQEPGVIQHIGNSVRARDGGWVFSFTEEWPVGGQTHQASVTLNAARPDGLSSGMGDVLLNYRYQAAGGGDARVAFAPRLSVVLPAGDREHGSVGAGPQVNLPLSARLLPRLVGHLNLGGTWLPSARDPGGAGGRGALTVLSGGGSLVVLLHPKLNLMLEALYLGNRHALPGGTVRSESLTVNPGLRAAIDFASGLQIVPGISFPVGVGPSRGERAVLFYLSFEHPCRLAGPTDEPPGKRS